MSWRAPSWAELAGIGGSEGLVGWLREANAADDGVVGVGLGRPRRDGAPRDELAAVIVVRRKEDRLGGGVPARLFGLPTDVVQGGEASPPLGPTVARDQARRRGGGRVHVAGRAWGTLACAVGLRDAPGRYALANAHVIVPPGPLVPPDGHGPLRWVSGPAGVEVFDDEPWCPERRPLGPVSRFVPLAPAARGHNLVDAAVVALAAGEPEGVAGLGAVRGALGPADVRLGTLVRKVGAASAAVATGEVELVRAAWVLRTGDYGRSGTGGAFLFAEQLVARVHQVGGDSGAALLDGRGRLAGLVHAWHPRGWALASPPWALEAALGVAP